VLEKSVVIGFSFGMASAEEPKAIVLIAFLRLMFCFCFILNDI
jgi:hypothetical protein